MESNQSDALLDELWQIWCTYTVEQKRDFFRMFPSVQTEEKPHICESAP